MARCAAEGTSRGGTGSVRRRARSRVAAPTWRAVGTRRRVGQTGSRRVDHVAGADQRPASLRSAVLTMAPSATPTTAEAPDQATATTQIQST